MSDRPKAARCITLRARPTIPLTWLDELAALPMIYSQPNAGEDALVRVKFFDPCGSWTWYATEAAALVGADEQEIPIDAAQGRTDTVNVMFYGLVVGQEIERGYWTLRDLASGDGQFGIGIERDCWWTPKAIGLVEAEARKSRGGR